MIEGVLGSGEGENAEAEAPVGLDPIAAALAIKARAEGEVLPPSLERYLDQQRELVRIQSEHLHEQRAVMLTDLRLRVFGERLKLGLRIFTALAFTVLGAGLGVMIYDAVTSRSVVVEPFEAPPALAARGVSGKVVAAGVLDALQKLSDATRTTRKALNSETAWSSDIRIEVPETGVSIGEIGRLLRQRFGHDVHVEGDLVQTAEGGLALTVRGDGVPAKTFEGQANALDALTAQGAEYIYSRSQPYQFAVYLLDDKRAADALAFIPGAFARAATDLDRSKLASAWGIAFDESNQAAKAAEKYRLAIQLDPTNWVSRGNLIAADASAFGEEAAWRESQAFLKQARAAPKRDRPELRLLDNPAQETWDLPLLLAANLNDARYNAGVGAKDAIDGPVIAETYALMHDPAEAGRFMASSDPEDRTTKLEAELIPAYVALDRGDPAGAVAPLEAFWSAWLKDPSIQAEYSDNGCLLGLAYGLTGKLTQAEAVFKRVGPWSRCYAYHGDVLEHAGDLPAAERVWAEGLRVGPDLLFIYMERGLSEERRGDLKAAERDLSTAAAKAPHFADAVKAYADLLAREGRWKEALAQYDSAVKSAPAWVELHRARDAAAAKA
ncbi:MAG: hypothetical protein KGL69_00930 [Alphaproteobacteria bacterium]|nr:hypothetical protein [Alphaproteobacteria bacterium]